MINKKLYLSIYTAAHNNAIDLLHDARILYNAHSYPRAYFLAFTALEEISKSQLAADIFTGLVKADRFWKIFTNHNRKIERVVWATLAANEYPNNIFADTDERIEVNEPEIEKRMNSLYVSIKDKKIVSKPKDNVTEQDAKEMIHTAEVALHQIFLMTEYYGHQIGTKGFMK